MFQRCVVYLFQCGLCDAGYVGYTCHHLHQRIEEHKGSVIGNHLREDGVLQVGGRLNRAELPYNATDLMILLKKHHITRLIVVELHHRHHREIAENQQCK